MRKLLFVDDEAMVLDGLRDLLRSRRREWHMVFADGAEAALRELAAQPFDVVISDIVLPRVSGVELLRRIRTQAPDVQVIIMTGGLGLTVDDCTREAVAQATGHRLGRRKDSKLRRIGFADGNRAGTP